MNTYREVKAQEGFTLDMHYAKSDYPYPWKVSAALSPCRVMLDSIQHQIQ